MSNTNKESMPSRRQFAKKAAYIAPLILTFNVRPAIAGSSSPGCPPHRPPGHHHRPNWHANIRDRKGPGFLRYMTKGNK